MLIHLPLKDSGTILQRHSLPGHQCFEEHNFSSAGLESANAAHERHSYTSDAHEQRRLLHASGAYHFDSSSSIHLQCPRIDASHSPRSKPYLTNCRKEEGLIWPCASSPAVYNKGVDIVRNNNYFYRELRAVYITVDGCHYVWQKAQTAILHYTRGQAD